MERLNSLSESNWITPEFLEFFCRANDLVIGCGGGAERLWVSPFGFSGAAPRERIGDIVRESLNFEVIPMDQFDGVRYFMTRPELENQLRKSL